MWRRSGLPPVHIHLCTLKPVVISAPPHLGGGASFARRRLRRRRRSKRRGRGGGRRGRGRAGRAGGGVAAQPVAGGRRVRQCRGGGRQRRWRRRRLGVRRRRGERDRAERDAQRVRPRARRCERVNADPARGAGRASVERRKLCPPLGWRGAIPSLHAARGNRSLHPARRGFARSMRRGGIRSLASHGTEEFSSLHAARRELLASPQKKMPIV